MQINWQFRETYVFCIISYILLNEKNKINKNYIYRYNNNKITK